VFFPVVFLYGVSKYLFTALALGVVLSLFASYVVALSVVPLFCAKFIKPKSTAVGKRTFSGRFQRGFEGLFTGLLDTYGRQLNRSLSRPVLTVVAVLGFFLLSLGLFPLVGVSYFPKTDPGQFVVNLDAPTGTRIDLTAKYAEKVENIIRQEVAAADLDVVVSNIGVTPGFSSIYTSNSAQHTAFVQASLKPTRKISSYDYMARVRRRVRAELPELSAYFQTGGIVDAVTNLGYPAPIDLQVTGSNLEAAHEVATHLAQQIRKLEGVSDVLVPQSVDYPALQLDIDRARASELGLTSKEVVQNVITALTSNQMIAPSYWVDPKSGNDYLLTVQYPENYIRTFEDLMSIPLKSPSRSMTTRLDAVSKFTHIQAPTEVDHYQLRRVIDVYVSPAREDLGRLLKSIQALIAETKLPEGIRIDVRGSAQGMQVSFRSFGLGLILAVVLVYLILVAQFQSFIDPLLILLAVPTGLSGVLIVLFATGTTLNVMSLMGVVMVVGIVVSNSILIVDSIRQLSEHDPSLIKVIALACRVRLRPVLITSLATLIGLAPMAAKFGTGSEAYAPLAMAIIGGLAVSFLLTIFIVPAAYLLVHKPKPVTVAAPAPAPA
jgi:multidrug efflux pump subunit AcrB